MSIDNRSETPQAPAVAGLTRPALEIPGAITLVEEADVGVNRALIGAQGLKIVIQSYALNPGDNVLVYIDNRLVLVWPVENDCGGRPISQYIPAKLIPEGFITLTYRVNVEVSAPLKVLIKTLLPGGIDPQPDAAGHYLLAPPLLTSTTLNGQQDETVYVAPYDDMRQNDVVTLIVGNSALPHTVTATEVGQSLTFTLSRDLVGSNGDGGVVLYYTIRDEVGNRATDHSLSVSVMIQTGSAAPIPPTVTGIGEQNTLYLSQLGSQSVIVSLDTRAFRPGDVLTLFWMGLDRTGMPTSLTEVQTLKSQTTLDFTIANAVIQTLAGGSARIFFTRTDAQGGKQQLPSKEILIVGNTRRISASNETQNQEAVGGILAAPENSVLKIIPPIILGRTEPVVGADCGVALAIYDNNFPNGADVIIDSFVGAAAFDVIDLLLNGNIVDTEIVRPGTENARHSMTIPNGLLNPNAVNTLEATVSRVSNNTQRSTPLLDVLYNAIRPGNRDINSIPGHSELQLKLPQDILDNGLDAARAALGVEVSFCYPYCRAHDVVELRMGSLTVRFTVLPREAPQFGGIAPICIVRTLTAQQFQQAGDSPQFTFTYTVHDQITNGADPSDPFSVPVVIDVDLAGVRRPAPIFFDNPNDTDSAIIDLEQLGSNNLSMLVRTFAPQFAIGDTIRARYSSPPSPDFFVDGTITGQFGQPNPLALEVPNNLVISGRLVTGSYVQSRSGVAIANSRIATARVIGQGMPDLPPPIVLVAPNGVLDPKDNPQGAVGRVTVPGFTPGDQVQLVVRGSAGDGSPTFAPLPLNAAGQADFPLSLAFINANLGQVVRITYLLIRGAAQQESRVLDLTVLNVTATPTITSVTSGGGVVPDRGQTYYRSLGITGTGPTGQSVEVLINNVPIGQYPVNSNNVWTVPARVFIPTTHTITVRTIDGSNKSSTRVVIVLEGLSLHIAQFAHQDMGGWTWGGAGRHDDFSWKAYPAQNYYHLHNYTYTNNSSGVVLQRTFNNLTPGATYLLSSGVFRSNTPYVHPQLQLGNSAGDRSPNYYLSVIHQLISMQLTFIATSPVMTMYYINNEASGTGNDWYTTHIQVQRMSL
ncbi:hypothetical protein HKK52_27085 [Pseudomonas sp. ADAK2]|uniref:hypothetical protein n=1 Tax=unclassified Pseudomonas TaxID=196821 RepID=UPI001463BC79|nr:MULTISPECIES: hypothetical protein [unclassified Pseudomonas]QJI44465.1 hypothetical protein HKK53_27085 [Pseudomonas sp. ADAK7]QJI50766.1 hypothetical protein HKK52_27085 [Pseudomonas sp. ADAK2]